MFAAAVAAADPAHCVPPHLPPPPAGRTLVLGAGKAAAAMAEAVEQHWPGPISGLVVTRYGHARTCRRIEVVEAGHPVPDRTGRDAARRLLELAEGAGEDDLVLALVSGGGSALLALPAPGITLADKQEVNRRLLDSGASIFEINTVRKHLSAIKGGRLAAAAAPARVLTLAISDVPGDDPATIASGPTVADDSTFAEARAVLAQYGIDGPPSVLDHLNAADGETPKQGDPRLAGAACVIIATPASALEEAARVALIRGLTPITLGDAIEGDSREVAEIQAEIARRAARAGALPTVILSGGETTVRVTGRGRGGPNGEYLLALALALDGAPGIYALAGDTDGIDGSEDNAGALIAPGTLARARAAGLDPASYLADNDSHGFFSSLGDLLVTGPTLTNVSDFRAILVTEAAKPGARRGAGG